METAQQSSHADNLYNLSQKGTLDLPSAELPWCKLMLYVSTKKTEFWYFFGSSLIGEDLNYFLSQITIISVEQSPKYDIPVRG